MFGWQDDTALTQVLPAAEARALTKHFGYRTITDLLGHLPRTYARHGESLAIDAFGDALEGDLVTIVGQIVHTATRRDRRGNIMLTISIDDGSIPISATFFNARWLQDYLTVGKRGMFAGKLKFFRGVPQLQHPDYVLFPDAGGKTQQRGGLGKAAADIDELLEILAQLRYIPIYPAKKAVPSWRMLGNMYKAVMHLNQQEALISAQHLVVTEAPDTPPELPSLAEAITGVHFPDERGPEVFIDRLKYQEALALGCAVALRRQEQQQTAARPLPLQPDGLCQQLQASLPYELTTGQQKVIDTISTDLAQTHPMHRLLQGEVGSGKTVVALHAMLQAVAAGTQCAFLAPTEVLASQHAAGIRKLLAAADLPVHVVVLTGSLTTAARKQALLDIVSGEADIVIGTHALIQDGVEFYELGLCVIDEQHRFGVEQREQLRLKAQTSPHVLVMTATPIPRTVAMTVFGDLDTSVLRELPGGRQPIESFVVPSSQPRWIVRMLDRVAEEIDKGHQAYIVCPRINEDGGVLAVADQLQHTVLGRFRIGVLHGSLDAATKAETMAAFADGALDILVATTVIEVGVDVPNATAMIIREAEHFGISQLHQLRGRVGRGGHASICFFYTNAPADSPTYERLSAVAGTMNGFELAELDLAIRSEGDVTSGQQSGRNRSLKLLHVVRDQDVIGRASEDATALAAQDPALARVIADEIAAQGQEFLTKT